MRNHYNNIIMYIMRPMHCDDDHGTNYLFLQPVGTFLITLLLHV